MARESIDTELTVIQSSKYGSQMRAAIHDALEKLDGNEQQDAGAVVSIGQTVDSLGATMGNLQSFFTPDSSWVVNIDLSTYNSAVSGSAKVKYLSGGLSYYEITINVHDTLSSDEIVVDTMSTDNKYIPYSGSSFIDNVTEVSIDIGKNTSTSPIKAYLLIDNMGLLSPNKPYKFYGIYRNNVDPFSTSQSGATIPGI